MITRYWFRVGKNSLCLLYDTNDSLGQFIRFWVTNAFFFLMAFTVNLDYFSRISLYQSPISSITILDSFLRLIYALTRVSSTKNSLVSTEFAANTCVKIQLKICPNRSIQQTDAYIFCHILLNEARSNLKTNDKWH